MDSLYFVSQRAISDLDSDSRRTLIATGLWMRTGFVGASMLVIGLILLFNGEAKVAVALAIALAGAGLAAFAWRRLWTLLSQPDADATNSPTAPLRKSRDVVAASVEAPQGDSVFASD